MGLEVLLKFRLLEVLLYSLDQIFFSDWELCQLYCRYICQLGRDHFLEVRLLILLQGGKVLNLTN
jgi:hypothetical protein